jgi:endonuclease/exonuclease/phosphatase family metal-dependent hydrolase
MREVSRTSCRAECGSLEGTNRPYKDEAEKRIDYMFTFDETPAVSSIVDPAGETISDHRAVQGAISLDWFTGAAPKELRR